MMNHTFLIVLAILGFTKSNGALIRRPRELDSDIKPECLAFLAVLSARSSNVNALSECNRNAAANIQDCLKLAFCGENSTFSAPNIYVGADIITNFVATANQCVSGSCDDAKSCLSDMSSAVGVDSAAQFSECVLRR
mmetsp:Transcript_26163/g.37533  ORF Transcript_26163/g.37533 Transcript_26163/m.37533 type:complete len:137 (-) Transcript_26163:57-467(-)